MGRSGSSFWRDAAGVAVVVAVIGGSLVVGPRLGGGDSRPRQPLPPQARGASFCPNARLSVDRVESREGREAVLCLINAERSAKHLPPLASEPRLEATATGFAREMRDRDFFSHEGPNGSTPESRIAASGFPRAAGGENLAWGEREAGTPSAIVRGWMDSPGHRANILRHQFRFIGIGIVRGSPLNGRPEQGAAIYVTPFGG